MNNLCCKNSNYYASDKENGYKKAVLTYLYIVGTAV
jgi:hypothetical protein